MVGRNKRKFSARYYIETIILKLDRIEAELEMVKLAAIENSRQARVLDEKIKIALPAEK